MKTIFIKKRQKTKILNLLYMHVRIITWLIQICRFPRGDDKLINENLKLMHQGLLQNGIDESEY